MGIVSKLKERMHRPIFYEGLRDRINSKMERGALDLDAPFTSIADSLEVVELVIELEELDIKIPINTVGDFLWLIKAIEFRKSKASGRKTD